MLHTLEQLDKPLDAVLKMAKLFFYAGIALGVVLLLRYCGSIGYYPSNVSVGDSIVFIATSLSFSLGYLLIVAMFLCSGVALSPLAKIIQHCFIFLYARTKNLEVKPKLIIFPDLRFHHVMIILLGFIMLLAIALAFYKNPFNGWGLLATSVLMTLFYGLWNTLPNIEDQKGTNSGIKVKVWLAIAIFSIPLFVGKVHDKGLKWAMTAIGIRIEGATVQLTDNYAQIFEQNGIEPEKKNGKKLTGYYTNANILFNGVGTNNVIEINGFKLIIPTKDVIIGNNTTTPKKI